MSMKEKNPIQTTTTVFHLGGSSGQARASLDMGRICEFAFR
jgi:hypothetical protein